jgi:hypothetical protein
VLAGLTPRGRKPTTKFFQILNFGGNDAVHSTTLADMLYDSTRIQVLNRNKAILLEVILNASMRIKPTVGYVEIAADEARNLYPITFHFLIVDTVIANVDVGGYKDLTRIRGVGENFLITCHACVKTDFASGSANFSGSFAMKNGAIF